VNTSRYPLVIAACLASFVAVPASAVEIETGKVDVTFHISHPAKEYDAFLVPDGGYAKLQVDPQAIENTTAAITIKVDHFNSDNTRRDSHMLETMEAFVYPTIQWQVDKISKLSGPLTPGSHTGVAAGPLTVHGVTKQLEIPIELTVGGQAELTIGASFTILLEDFGIERPTLVFVPIENELPIIVKVQTKAKPELLEAAKPPPPAPPPAPAEDAAPAPSAPEEGQ